MELHKRGMGYSSYDPEAALREAANGFGPRSSDGMETADYSTTGSDLLIIQSDNYETLDYEYPDLDHGRLVEMVDSLDQRVAASLTAESANSRSETISDDEFERRILELHEDHPQFVDGVTVWLANYMDQKYHDLEQFDVADPAFQEDLKALVESIYVASKHDNEQFDIIDIEFLIVDAIEKIEGINQEDAREKLVKAEHIYDDRRDLADSPLVAA